MTLRSAILLLVLLAVAACGGRASRPEGGPGAPAGAAAVERFLQLAGERNYVQMGWVFGTEEGPILERDPQAEVEQRMYALARVLAHDSYVLGQPAPVPGRTGRAERYSVTLRRGDRGYQVPIVAVRGGDRWYVEQVDLEAITNVR